MIRTILVAIDLGPVAEVLASAGTLAGLLGADLHVRHVSTSVPGSSLPSASADALRRDDELLRVLVERTLAGVEPASVRVLSGRPADAILSADRVVRESRLPVLVVLRSQHDQIGCQLARLRRKADEAGIGTGAELHVVSGDPTLELLALQQRMGADLIVVGSHGAGSVGSALLGSVAYSVVRGSTCAVFVVR